jgi:uncharacterized protein (TIGR02145 family)
MKKTNTFSLFPILFLLIIASCTNKNNDILPDGGSTSTVTDIDGNVYKTVKIGTQVWMAENLKTTKYNNGNIITNITNPNTWRITSTGAWCNYENDAETGDKYGKLYNWYAVNTGNLAPKGWHVPTDAEWTILENYLILNGYNFDGTTSGNKIAKSLAAKTDWTTNSDLGTIGNDLSKNNSSGFNALPGGWCSYFGEFGFTPDSPTDGFIRLNGYWWCYPSKDTPDTYIRHLYYGTNIIYGSNSSKITHLNTSSLYRDIGNKQWGLSVRCIKD